MSAITELLIAHGADLLLFLLDHDAQPDLRNALGARPVDMALEAKTYAIAAASEVDSFQECYERKVRTIVRRLVDMGVSLESDEIEEGSTLLHEAIAKSNYEVVCAAQRS